MHTKNLTITLVVLVAVIGMTFSAGCLDNGPAKKTKKAPEVLSGSMEPQSGWLNYDAQPITFNISANGTALISLNVTVAIQDSDDAHAQTDEGSDPDTVQIDVKSVDGAWSVSQKLSTTEGTTTITIPNENITVSDGETLPTDWTITISGVQFGGGVHPTGPAGIVPIPFLTYVDQGCAYKVSAEYQYEA